MKKSYQFFVWIVLIVMGLMAVLVITQINSSSSVDRLVMGNKQAAATFLVNNRLEEMINLSFEVESKMLLEKPPYVFKNRPAIKDSLNKLLLKTGMLNKIMHEAGISSSLEKIFTLVNQQVALSSAILSTDKNSSSLDSLRKMHFGDSIYVNSLAFQMEMEKALGGTLNENNQVAKKISLFNKLLAFIALAAILLLGTIIIRRQVMQFLLIRDLEQARKLALQSVKIKDQFLANMSHEIRTPLNALKGFSNLLSKTKLNEEQQQFSNIINSSSESLLHIVNDILDLSKIEAGALAIKNKQFSLSALLKNIEITYSVLAIEKKLVFSLLLADNIEDNIIGDPDRLKQVLMNLISNAIKFTNEGYVKLEVSLSDKNDEEESIHFIVKDTGIGIPYDKQELIFERFEQLDNSFIRQQGGTGLGLAITQKIIQSMGGAVTVESEPGKGSLFSFMVRFKINRLAGQGKDIPEQKLNPIISDPECKTVLLAEDNKVNQLLIQKLLIPFNIFPVIVENGQDVLKLLEQNQFDLVLMDVQMPLMDGISTTIQIRNNLKKNIPVIGMTAYVQPIEIEKCFAAGMNECITKPIDEKLFLSVLKKYIYLDDAVTQQLSASNLPSLIDLSLLKEICNGNYASMQLILQTIKSELLKESHLFENALARKDFDDLRKISHHMKSTISPLGSDVEIARLLDYVVQLLNTDSNLPALEEAGKQLLLCLKDFVELIDV